MPLPVPGSPDVLQRAMDETRERFVTSFPAQCDSIRILIDKVATFGPRGPVAALTQIAHRLSGLAGTIGFPTISARAAELETLVGQAGTDAFDASLSRAALEAIRQAFTTDLARPPQSVASPVAKTHGAKILVAEDESAQRAIVTACLQGAGYVAIPAASGDIVASLARRERPSVILLDIGMPGLDGYAVCRRLKSDPELAGIPVIFMTAGADLDDRLAGLTLGADEFLHKPLDMRELLLRIALVLKRNLAPVVSAPPEPGGSPELTYEAFVAVANEEMARQTVALAIVRLEPDRRREGSLLLIEEVRGRDTIGGYGLNRLLVLMPETAASAARARLEVIVDRLIAKGLTGISVGIAASDAADAKSAADLIGEADEALVEARYLGLKTAIWRARGNRQAAPLTTHTIVVAEDDPDVTRIVDAQFRAAGFTTVLAFDGEQTLAAIGAHAPDVLVLDLMMPKLNGFDVLTQLRGQPGPKPRIIVLSGRGREEDVMRAFDLGADDYMTKPFNPQELMARVARLFK